MYSDNVRCSLIKLREQNGLSQTELGNLTGLKQVNISRYENGERNIKIDDLGRLIDFYHVPADIILGTNGKKFREE